MPKFTNKIRLPLMKENGGSIINFISDAAQEIDGQSVYRIGKSAIGTLTRASAIELGKYNIRVNNVLPVGVTDTVRPIGGDTERLMID